MARKRHKTKNDKFETVFLKSDKNVSERSFFHKKIQTKSLTDAENIKIFLKLNMEQWSDEKY